MFIATRVGVPALTIGLNLDPLLAWFIAAGVIVFLPLLGLAAILLRLEGDRLGPELWVNRLRFRSVSRSELRLAFLGVVIVALVTGGLTFVLVTLSGPAALQPSFLPIGPLERERYWLLAAWLPFFVLNIMGEEILWRGVLLPRQEAAHGRAAWVINGLGWAVFHIAFGWHTLVLAAPILFVLPYAVQRTRNSWVGVIIHAALNGPAFVAVSVGALG